MLRNFRALILGAPGSGKGTISARVVKKFDIKHVSCGDVLRQNIMRRTKLGLDAKNYMDLGQLVPDEIIIEVIASELSKLLHGNWLLDGFPRTRIQAEELHKREPVDVAMNLVVPFDIIFERIKGRWIHIPSGRVYNVDYNAPKVPGIDDVTGEKLVQRIDDRPEAVQKRLEVYCQTVDPILDFYRTLGILEEFHGKTSDEIWPQIYKFLALHVTQLSQDIKI